MSSQVITGLSKIKNAQKSQKLSINVRRSSFLLKILKALRNEGYIRGFVVKPRLITVFLKYINGKPAFSCIRVVSKSSRRLYFSKRTLLNLASTSQGSFFLTTSSGVFVKKEILTQKSGGEGVLFIT